ncbi:MAG TPA: ABC transporter ATP-binding protein [Burkholderiales bacterium]|nr:ABC transporter ATP-binding protein [Burkholderiales bacterium]
MAIRLRDSAVSIRLEACGKTFPDGTRALEPLTLGIAAGETVVFLGPSGCGKTTTLRLIAGLETPDAGGRVRFGDDDVTALPIEKRNVGMVFQSYALFPNMSVAQNVAYGLRVRRVASAARAAQVTEMLDLMHLQEFANRSVDQLSGGQRQRVALARALIVKPRVLLLDEPLTALDAKLRETLRVEIDRLLRELEITTIYVTHDQAEAMSLGDRIVVMEKGRVAQVGTPQEIYYRPANRFVAEFIGTMNRLRGVVRGGLLEIAGGRLPCDAVDGEVAELGFRPEDARIADASDGALAGRVAAAFFLGDRTRVIVEGVTDELIVVESSQRRQFVKGETVHIAVRPDTLLRLN